MRSISTRAMPLKPSGEQEGALKPITKVMRYIRSSKLRGSRRHALQTMLTNYSTISADMKIHVSMPRLASDMGVHEATARRLTQALVREGWLHLARPSKGGTDRQGRGITN